MEKPNKQEGESLFNFAHPPVAEDAVAGQGGLMNFVLLLRGRTIIDVYEEIRYTVLVELIKLDKLCFNRTRHDMQQFENVRQLPQST